VIPRRRADGVIELEPSTKDALKLQQIDEADRVRKATRGQIARLQHELQAMANGLGVTQYLDAVIVRTVAAMSGALAIGHMPAERDLAIRLVRDAGTTLANARRDGLPLNAEALADEMIAKSAGVPDLIPFAAKLPSVREALVNAVEASSRRGAPKKDVRGRQRKQDDGAARKSRDALLRALDLPVVSKDGEKSARRRLKRERAGSGSV
jgi:hypothetical protein